MTARPLPLLVVLATLACLSVPGRAAAQDAALDAEVAYASRAVQNRHYRGTHEITLFGGILPLDAFRKGLTLGGAYTWHIDDQWAWEAIGYLHSFDFATDLEDDLDALEIEPTPFAVVQDVITTNFMWKPIYLKGAVANRRIVFGEIGLLVGGGLGFFSDDSRRPMVNYGGLLRFYLARALSLRVDVRHMMFFDDTSNELDLQHELWTAIGLAAELG
ncbi:MAG: outer membrane beta-barrel domain-containing protein [Myxococcota bacterium]